MEPSQKVIRELLRIQNQYPHGQKCGYVSGDNVYVNGSSNTGSITVPYDTEKNGSVFCTFSTNPNTWIFHNVIYESMRRYFANDQQNQIDFVVTEKHVCTFLVQSDSKIVIDDSEIQGHILNIQNIQEKYIEIIIDVMGDAGLFENVDDEGLSEYEGCSINQLQEFIIDKTNVINIKLNEIVNTIYPAMTVKFEILKEQ